MTQENKLHSDRVFRASDGRLYLAGGASGVASLYTDEGFSVAVNCQSWEERIFDRQNKIEIGGARFFQLLAPEKLTIYSLNPLDRSILFAGYSNEDIVAPGRRLMGSITKSGIIYPDQYLKEQSVRFDVYPMTDSHWTWKGAFSAFQLLMFSMAYKPDYNTFLTLPKTKNRYYGDLWENNMIDIPQEQMERIQSTSSVRRVYSNSLVGLKESLQLEDESRLHQGSHCIFCNNNAEFDKTVVLFGSSFSESRLAPSLLTAIFAHYFRTVHFIWSSSLDFAYVKRHQAAIVIAETPERLLTHCPTDELLIEQYAVARIDRWYNYTKTLETSIAVPPEDQQAFIRLTYDDLPKWDVNQDECCRLIETQSSELKILLKTKNDSFFLEKWILHHLGIVGSKNIVIFDNMSDSPEVLKIYAKYWDRIIVIRFGTFHNLVHNTEIYGRLYESLACSSKFFSFLDSDEFLVMTVDGRIWRDKRIIEYLETNAHSDLFPGLWLNNTDWNESRFSCGTKPSDLIPKAAWGKPIIRSNAGVKGFLNHNAFLDRALYAHALKANFFVLHMTNLSVKQRIQANMNKLTARKFGSPDDTPEEIVNRSLKEISDFNIHLYIDEIKKLLQIKVQPKSGAGLLRAGCFEIMSDESIVFYSDVEKNLISQFISNPSQVYNDALDLADKRDDRVKPGAA